MSDILLIIALSTEFAEKKGGYSAVGIVAVPAMSAGLIALGVSTGPAGWIALAAWGVFTLATSGYVQDAINSLD